MLPQKDKILKPVRLRKKKNLPSDVLREETKKMEERLEQMKIFVKKQKIKDKERKRDFELRFDTQTKHHGIRGKAR